jgi:uroporphyrinogen-III decarboxylase
MEGGAEIWVELLGTLKDAPPLVVMIAAPWLILAYLALVATRANRENPTPKIEAHGDSEKLDEILTRLATITANVDHLKQMETSVQKLMTDVARIEGRLAERK